MGVWNSSSESSGSVVVLLETEAFHPGVSSGEVEVEGTLLATEAFHPGVSSGEVVVEGISLHNTRVVRLNALNIAENGFGHFGLDPLSVLA